MRRFISLVTAAVLMVVMLLPAGVTSAQQQFGTIVAEVGPTAKLLDDGQAVQVNVTVQCEPPVEVREALVTVRQDAEAAFGEAVNLAVGPDAAKEAGSLSIAQMLILGGWVTSSSTPNPRPLGKRGVGELWCRERGVCNRR